MSGAIGGDWENGGEKVKRKEYQKYQELAADLGHAGLVALEASGWQNIYHKLVE